MVTDLKDMRRTGFERGEAMTFAVSNNLAELQAFELLRSRTIVELVRRVSVEIWARRP
jgi:hypothetical protein